MIRSLLLAGLVVLVGPMAACKPAATPARPRPGRPRPRPLPSHVIFIGVELKLPPVPGAALAPLPPFKRIKDPSPAPRMKLRYLRRKAAYSRSGKRQLMRCHLAARLWTLAQDKLRKIGELEARARASGEPRPQSRILRLQQAAAAHLKECVALLEGVLETTTPPAVARWRLAHYLRRLNPSAAIPHYRALLTGSEGKAHFGYRLDLAQLYLATGKAAAARRVLAAATAPLTRARPLLLQGLALAHGGGSAAQLEANLKRLIGAAAQAKHRYRPAIVIQLPRLVAELPKVKAVLRVWIQSPSAREPGLGGAITARFVDRLLDRGRTRQAAVALSLLQGASLKMSATSVGRLKQVAGPFPRRSQPPTTRDWIALIKVRLPDLLPCLLRKAGRWRAQVLELVIDAEGRVRQAQLRAADEAPPPGGSRAAVPPSPRQRCLNQLVSSWRLPSWRANTAVRLAATLRP